MNVWCIGSYDKRSKTTFQKVLKEFPAAWSKCSSKMVNTDRNCTSAKLNQERNASQIVIARIELFLKVDKK